jgi:SAM-dependent methyltransferase
MHDTAYRHGKLFFDLYWNDAFDSIVELGSQNVNGSLRDHCPPGARYVGLDMAPGRGVDLVVESGRPLPLADSSVDVVVTSSCFEHDVCYWETFLELLRILRPGGLLYLNAPSNCSFHRFPLDCWRFYPDAGAALIEWARRRSVQVELLESFVAFPENDGWSDFVGVFRKADGQAFSRRGRIADQTRAMNVYDAGMPVGGPLEQESWQTPDMAAMAKAVDEIRTLIAERNAVVAAAAGERDTALVALEHERTRAASLEQDLQSSRLARDDAIARADRVEADPLWRLLAKARGGVMRLSGRPRTA